MLWVVDCQEIEINFQNPLKSHFVAMIQIFIETELELSGAGAVGSAEHRGVQDIYTEHRNVIGSPGADLLLPQSSDFDRNPSRKTVFFTRRQLDLPGAGALGQTEHRGVQHIYSEHRNVVRSLGADLLLPQSSDFDRNPM